MSRHIEVVVHKYRPDEAGGDQSFVYMFPDSASWEVEGAEEKFGSRYLKLISADGNPLGLFSNWDLVMVVE